MPEKRPKAAYQPTPKKAPRAADTPTQSKRPRLPAMRGGVLSWRFSSVDRNGPFAWSRLDDPAAYMAAMEQLHGFETMEENAIREQGSHFVEWDKLSKPARDRSRLGSQVNAEMALTFGL